MISERPRIKIEPGKTDRRIKFITFAVLAAIIAFSIWLYMNSPEIVPAHYGFDGKIDRYDHKITLFIMPAIAVVIISGLTILAGYPHLFNYPQSITSENAAVMYKKGARLMRYLSLGIALLFLFLEYQEYSGIKNKFLPMHWWELFLAIAATLIAPLIISMAAFKRLKK